MINQVCSVPGSWQSRHRTRTRLSAGSIENRLSSCRMSPAILPVLFGKRFLLDAHSPIGKDLDSLADDVSFGVAPSLVVFSLFKEMHYPASMEFMAAYMPYASFLISVFSALRLAKFNNDTRQTSSFIGVPVPANALFWASLAAGMHPMLISDSFNPLYLLMLVCLFSWLLVSEIPMFSLKFKNLSWKDNKISFIFLIVCIPLLVFLKVSGFAAVIVWYIVLSLLTGKSK